MFNKEEVWSLLVICSVLLTCTTTTEITDLTPPTLLSPGQGETITTNPPTFVWNAVQGDSCDLVYRIEIAGDESFNMSSLIISTMVTLPDTTFTPSAAFTAGIYYWHMCVRQNA